MSLAKAAGELGGKIRKIVDEANKKYMDFDAKGML